MSTCTTGGGTILTSSTLSSTLGFTAMAFFISTKEVSINSITDFVCFLPNLGDSTYIFTGELALSVIFFSGTLTAKGATSVNFIGIVAGCFFYGKGLTTCSSSDDSGDGLLAPLPFL